MKQIKVLGSGCGNCKATAERIRKIADANGVEIELEKVEDMQEIIRYGILATPGVVVDGEVVHAGGLPSRSSIKNWLLKTPAGNTEKQGD
ncbi:MAG: thioredoxin family protein [Mariprofundaceae bacterium]|nr:thioredoxin family protein [Mariprofundaceae bacterium]